MNIIKYISEKIKSKVKKFKLYTATVVLTVTTATAGVLTACTNKTNNNSSKNTTEVVTEVPEVPDEKESAIEELIKAGIILEKEESYPDYYKIKKSSSGEVSSINDYFDEKGIVPYYDAKCSPVELAELMKDADFGHDGYTYGNISLGSAFCYNQVIDDNYKTKILTIIYNYLSQVKNVPTEIAAYNLANLTLKYVNEDSEYYSKFDPVERCIYVNRKYVKSSEEEDLALAYALTNACYNAYLEVDGKIVYCSLTDFYYDSKNNKLLEVGKTYNDFITLPPALSNNYEGEYVNLPTSQASNLYKFIVAEECLRTENMGIFSVIDFSGFLQSIVEKNKSSFPNESEKFNVAEILIKAELGDEAALIKAIDYYKYKVKNNSNIEQSTLTHIINNTLSWVRDLDSLKNKLSDYADVNSTELNSSMKR